MRKRKLLISAIAVNLLLGGTVFAGSAVEFTNGEEASNPDRPKQGKLVATRLENHLLTTKAEVQWSENQLDEFDNRNGYAMFPALEFEVDSTGQLKPKLMVTNLPGAKFERRLGADPEGERITVSVLGRSWLIDDKSYMFYTTWEYGGKGDPLVELSSMQRFAQPGGTLNDMLYTDDLLAGIRWNEAKENEAKWIYPKTIKQEPAGNAIFSYTADGKRKPLPKLISENADLDSQEALTQYEKEAKERLENVPEDAYVQFAITFKRPVGSEYINRLIEEYGLSIQQYYAIGYMKDSREELFTVSWFDNERSILNPLSQELGISFQGHTELEGKAKVEELKRLQLDDYVDVIDISFIDERSPTGVYWLNCKFGN